MKQHYYLSNDGRGPLAARILGRDGATFYMERWDIRSEVKRRTCFKLPAWFLASPACGWFKVSKALAGGED